MRAIQFILLARTRKTFWIESWTGGHFGFLLIFKTNSAWLLHPTESLSVLNQTCEFSSFNGRTLVSGSNDKLINIWKLSGHLTDPPYYPDSLTGVNASVSDEDASSSDIPFELMCPITQDIMRNPVKCSGRRLGLGLNLFKLWLGPGKVNSAESWWNILVKPLLWFEC